eukprot:scaffold9526_cov247-Amphora_coffeaeformis.AAC.8
MLRGHVFPLAALVLLGGKYGWALVSGCSFSFGDIHENSNHPNDVGFVLIGRIFLKYYLIITTFPERGTNHQKYGVASKGGNKGGSKNPTRTMKKREPPLLEGACRTCPGCNTHSPCSK